jgi:soluble lytic murein transglycosylase
MRVFILMMLTTVAFASNGSEVARLREAVNAYQAGQFDQCAKLARGLSESSLRNPDSALFVEAQCLFYARRYAVARERFRLLATNVPESPHAVLAAYRVADCDRELHDQQAALTHYQDAENLQPNTPDRRVDRAVGLMHRVDILIERDRQQASLRLLSKLHSDFPFLPLAFVPPDIGSVSLFTQTEAVSLAQALVDAGRRNEALLVLDRAPQPSTDRERYDQAYTKGRILFGMAGRYQEAQRLLFAARDYAPTPDQAEQAWFWGSRCFSRLGQDDLAIQSHRAMVDRYPQGDRAAAALFYAGWLEQNQGQCNRAWPLFEQLWQQYKHSRWAAEARWFHAWCSLRHQRWEEALAVLKLQLDHPDRRTAARARYWSAFADFSRGRLIEAETSWTSLSELYPLTWYALLARARLADKAPPVLAPPKASTMPILPNDPLLKKAKELVRAQLPAFAELVLRRGEKDFFAKHPNHWGRLALLEAYRGAYAFRHAWRAPFDKSGVLLRLPTAETRVLWDRAYPTYGRELVNRFGGRDTTVVLFLQSIMRTESGFDALALSPANARGLMQLIPSTATLVANELGLDPEKEDLFDPEFNVHAAAWYLDRLAKKFKGQWPLVAAAYNGGPPALMKWCNLFGQLPLDAFVESLPFAETREYVKTVIETLFRYAYLEGAQLPQLPLSIDPHFVEDDLTY